VQILSISSHHTKHVLSGVLYVLDCDALQSRLKTCFTSQCQLRSDQLAATVGLWQSNRQQFVFKLRASFHPHVSKLSSYLFEPINTWAVN
jgi:hypothetical protein